MQLKKPRYALTKTLGFGLHILVSNRVYKSLTSRHLTATKYSFSFTSSDKFWTRLIIIYQTCFHIMTQKTTGLVELNLQWELYIFTHLFSSTGLWWLLVLWIWFNYFLFILPLVSECLVNCTGQQDAPLSRATKSFLFQIW